MYVLVNAYFSLRFFSPALLFTVPFHHWSPMRKNKLIHYRLNDLTKGKSIGNRWMNPEWKKNLKKTLRKQEAAFWFKAKVKNRLNIQSDGCCCSVISKPSLLPLNLIFIKTKEGKKTTVCYLWIVFSALGDVFVGFFFVAWHSCRHRYQRVSI